MKLEETKKYTIILGVLIIVLFSFLIVLAVTLKPNRPTVSTADFIAKLPYITKDFAVVYSKEKNLIYINVYSPPYDQNRQNALDWIRAQGVDPRYLPIAPQ